MKVALVTGSAGGLGKRIALDLAGLGYTLIMNYRNKKPDLKKIQQLSPDSIEVRADVSKKSDVKKLFRKISFSPFLKPFGKFIFPLLWKKQKLA